MINNKRLMRYLKIEQIVEVLPYFIVVILFLLFTILCPSFASVRNIRGILTVSTVFLLVAAGETFPILMGSIDLSIGTMLSSSSIVAAYLFPSGGLWTIIVAIIMGLISGILNGSLVVALRLPSFIVTLAMMFAYRGLSTSLTSGYNINIRSSSFAWISNGEIIPGVPNIILWGAMVFVSKALWSLSHPATSFIAR